LAKSCDGCIFEPHPARVAMEMAILGRLQKLRIRLSDPSWFMAILCVDASGRDRMTIIGVIDTQRPIYAQRGVVLA
jgi:hypothetical protein